MLDSYINSKLKSAFSKIQSCVEGILFLQMNNENLKAQLNIHTIFNSVL